MFSDNICHCNNNLNVLPNASAEVNIPGRYLESTCPHVLQERDHKDEYNDVLRACVDVPGRCSRHGRNAENHGRTTEKVGHLLFFFTILTFFLFTSNIFASKQKCVTVR